MSVWLHEPAEQLGDTTPGALDSLPALEATPQEHPAVREARHAVAMPGAMRWVLPLVLLLTLLCSAVWPMGWGPASLP